MGFHVFWLNGNDFQCPVSKGILRQSLILNSPPGSITNAIAAICEHDQAAAELIWRRFFDRLCGYASSKIYDRHRRLISPDEIASNAFLALFTGLKEKVHLGSLWVQIESAAVKEDRGFVVLPVSIASDSALD